MKIDDDYGEADEKGKKSLDQARGYIMRLAPNTRMGTITDAHLDHGQVEYLLHHDQRFDDKLPDFYIYEDDFEICERPTDQHVGTINRLIRYGS